MSTRLPDGYRPLQLLARGRRLETWDAWDLGREVRVVVKVLREDRADDPRARSAVLQEAAVVCSLSHPHLVRGHAWFADPAAMVLETLQGATLAAVVEERTLSLGDAAELGVQLTSVLGHLHRHGWLHLDVKPSNVVVEHGRAVLIDLSLAHRPGDGRAGAGTRGYMAPEQARGEGLSERTDVFGLGVTLLETFSGELVHGAVATWDTRRWLPARPRTANRTVLAAAPGEVRALLAAMVEPRASARPTLAEVRTELLAFTEPPDAV